MKEWLEKSVEDYTMSILNNLDFLQDLGKEVSDEFLDTIDKNSEKIIALKESLVQNITDKIIEIYEQQKTNKVSVS